MQEFLQAKTQAWREYDAQFDCAHTDALLRKRVIRGGAVQFVYQCQRCGEAKSQPVSKKVAFDANGGAEPVAFDDGLRDAWVALREAAAENIRARFSKSEFHFDYEKYLASPEWESKRRMVLKRAQGVCEGCGSAVPSEVHHLSYEHVGSEFLFELVALCGACHDRIHADDSRS